MTFWAAPYCLTLNAQHIKNANEIEMRLRSFWGFSVSMLRVSPVQAVPVFKHASGESETTKKSSRGSQTDTDASRQLWRKWEGERLQKTPALNERTRPVQSRR